MIIFQIWTTPRHTHVTASSLSITTTTVTTTTATTRQPPEKPQPTPWPWPWPPQLWHRLPTQESTQRKRNGRSGGRKMGLEMQHKKGGLKRCDLLSQRVFDDEERAYRSWERWPYWTSYRLGLVPSTMSIYYRKWKLFLLVRLTYNKEDASKL